MDNVKALGEAMLMHQPEDLRGRGSLHCGDDCAQEIARHLYEAGYIIRPLPRAEREAVQTIATVLDALPSDESRRKVVTGVLNAR